MYLESPGELASLADHEEPHNVSVACSTPLHGGMLCNPFGLTRLTCLHASTLRLIWIQSGFNPLPEMDYLMQIRTQLNVFTRVWISLFWIPIQVKRCV